MIQLKIRQVGNSLGVVLPKELLTRLNVKNGDTLYLTDAPNGEMRVTPSDPIFDAQMHVARELMSQYRNTLRELAK
jgi:putative addiction module antidote